MTIALFVFLSVWVLWALAMVSMGDFKMIPMFTLGFIIAPIAITVLAIIAPIAVIFSKTARDAAIAERKKGGK